jgi:uncharacterized lipoprotein YddW (UPF0748 family)
MLRSLQLFLVGSIAWIGVSASCGAAPIKLLEFDASVAGAGNTPASQGWTQYGTAMSNNGSFLLQDNTGVPDQQSGEYLSPTLAAGTFTRGGADYGIEFKVRPLTDVGFVGVAWPEMYLTWSDDQFNYNITVDKYHDANTSGTGDIVYGRSSFSPAITGIDWTVPHTIFIGHRGSGGSSVFDFYLDGDLKSTIVDGSIARSGSFARDAVDFGDGTTGHTDVAGEWYFVRVWDVNAPVVVPEPSSMMLVFISGALVLLRRSNRGRTQTAQWAMCFAALVGLMGVAQPGAAHERGPGFGLYCNPFATEQETADFIEKCRTHGIQALHPSVSGSSAVIWKTDRENYYPEFQKSLDGGYDALADMIKKAHAAGIKVYPSVAVSPTTKILEQHPEWETMDREGNPSSLTTARGISLAYPAARQAKVEQIMDLVSNYDVDGIMLDYCRYPETTKGDAKCAHGFYGYDAPLIEACKSIHGFDPREVPIDSEKWRLFGQMRQDTVTSFVREMRQAIEKSGKKVRLGGFGDTNAFEEADMCGRNVVAWSRQGLIDDYYLATYTGDEEEMREVVANIREQAGPNVVLLSALTPFADRITTNDAMKSAANAQLSSGADSLWIYRHDFLEQHGLWDGAKESSSLAAAR